MEQTQLGPLVLRSGQGLGQDRAAEVCFGLLPARLQLSLVGACREVVPCKDCQAQHSIATNKFQEATGGPGKVTAPARVGFPSVCVNWAANSLRLQS